MLTTYSPKVVNRRRAACGVRAALCITNISIIIIGVLCIVGTGGERVPGRVDVAL